MALLQGKSSGEEVLKTVTLFDKSLNALISGNVEMGIPATTDATTLAQLSKVNGMWKEFKENIEDIVEHSGNIEKSKKHILSNNIPLLKASNKAVGMMDKAGLGAHELNIAGRQRMLSQKMTKEILSFDGVVVTAADVHVTLNLFDSSLKGLISGDSSMGLHAIKNGPILAQFARVENLWRPFKAEAEKYIEEGEELFNHVHYVMEHNVALLKEMNKAVGMYEGLSAKKVSNLKVTELVFLGLAIVCVAIGWFVITRFIVNPINSVVALARKMSDGDLSAKDLDVKGKDEVGTLSTALNTMKHNLNDIIGNLRSSADHVASATTQLSATASQIVSGADMQSNQTNQVATAMEEMSATVVEVAKNSQGASEASNETQQIAVSGGDVVKRAVDGMMAVADTVKQSAETVEALGKSSDEIGAIISVINDIADQTNLLALNAAIEAARAGEQGRGFAVVADEVRKLAEKTTKATKEIADMIKTIQNDTKGAMTSMHEGTKQVEEGVQLASEAGESLQQIVSSVDRVTDMVRQIATAAEEQSATTEEISTNITSIATVTQENTDGVKQVSAASDDLAKIADELKDIVSRFKLRGNSNGGFAGETTHDEGNGHDEVAEHGSDSGEANEATLKVV
jgi:methyl-accepting chemotaxis protein